MAVICRSKCCLFRACRQRRKANAGAALCGIGVPVLPGSVPIDVAIGVLTGVGVASNGFQLLGTWIQGVCASFGIRTIHQNHGATAFSTCKGGSPCVPNGRMGHIQNIQYGPTVGITRRLEDDGIFMIIYAHFESFRSIFQCAAKPICSLPCLM